MLTLNADCATWEKQLRHMTEEIRARINGFLGQPIVKKVRIKTVPAARPIFLRQAARATRSLRRTAARKSMNTDGIADPEIAAALANSYAKYFNRPRR